jgi:hypothetical protein
MAGKAAPLQLVPARGSLRYAIGDRVLSGGDVVELCCSGGWLTGRFEWDDGMDAPPRFYFSIELEGGAVDEQVIDVPEGALLRIR